MPKIQHTVFFKLPDLEHDGADYNKLQNIVKEGFCSIPGIVAAFSRHGSLAMDKASFLAHVDWPDRSGDFTHCLMCIGDDLDAMKAYLHSDAHKKDWMAAVGPYVKGIVVFDSELALSLNAKPDTILHSGLFKLQASVTDDSDVMKQLQDVVMEFNKLPGIKASFKRAGTAKLDKTACLQALDWPDKSDGFTHYLCVECESPESLKGYLHGDAHKAWVPIIRPNFEPDAKPPSLIFDNPLGLNADIQCPIGVEPAEKRPRIDELSTGESRSTSMASMIALSNGVKMPFVGLGTYLQSDEEAAASVIGALRCGYRHIDTAEFYANHKGIAKGIAEAGVPRSEIFITDKLAPGGIFGQPGAKYEDTMAKIKKSLELLQTDYLDLYLIHHPGAKHERLEQWSALCHAQEKGLVKAIGVSNYSEAHIEEIRAAGMKLPEANQIELHPLCTQTVLVTYLRKNEILPIAYSSLAPCSGWRIEKGQQSSKSEQHNKQKALLDAMCCKYGVNEAQILLKWALQKGYPIIPKSSKVERVESNSQLFHYEIDAEHIAKLDELDEDAALAWPIGNPLKWE